MVAARCARFALGSVIQIAQDRTATPVCKGADSRTYSRAVNNGVGPQGLLPLIRANSRTRSRVSASECFYGLEGKRLVLSSVFCFIGRGLGVSVWLMLVNIGGGLGAYTIFHSRTASTTVLLSLWNKDYNASILLTLSGLWLFWGAVSSELATISSKRRVPIHRRTGVPVHLGKPLNPQGQVWKSLLWFS